jgi:serine phosphatase RsbU (regulator of sigma subunit)
VPAQPVVAAESLEPGDLLLFYTDGLVDARGPDGERFTLEAIARFVEREVAAGHTAPETLRRIRHAIIGRERAQLRDDASALLVEWRAGDERRLMPQTVL